VQLPFTHDQFLDLFGEYNRALWPALIVLWIATVLAIGRLYQSAGTGSRAVAAVLAAHWAWAGGLYHLIYFRRINPAATLFGTAFLVQAGLVVWRGVLTDQLNFSPRKGTWGAVATVLILYSLLYPGLGLLLGLHTPRFPSFGVPCPTTLLGIGLLLLAPRREARILGVVPVLWAAIAGTSAFLLSIRADLALLPAGALLLVYMTRGQPEIGST